MVGSDEERVSEVEVREALKILASEEVVTPFGQNKNKPSVKLCKDSYNDK